MIEVQGLSKRYPTRLAVDDVTFSVKRGEIVGFLGPNGAGKTTTMRVLTGFLPPTSGSARVAGHDVVTQSSAARAALGERGRTFHREHGSVEVLAGRVASALGEAA